MTNLIVIVIVIEINISTVRIRGCETGHMISIRMNYVSHVDITFQKQYFDPICSLGSQNLLWDKTQRTNIIWAQKTVSRMFSKYQKCVCLYAYPTNMEVKWFEMSQNHFPDFRRG